MGQRAKWRISGAVMGKPPTEAPFAILAAESNGLFSVRNDRFKLVAQPARNHFELFDLEADPGERRDVAGAQPAELETLRGALRAWRASLKPLAATTTELDAETEVGLRSLGYIQ